MSLDSERHDRLVRLEAESGRLSAAGYNEGIEAAVAFMRARAERIRAEGVGNVSLMMARIYDDEADGIAALKRDP